MSTPRVSEEQFMKNRELSRGRRSITAETEHDTTIPLSQIDLSNMKIGRKTQHSKSNSSEDVLFVSSSKKPTLNFSSSSVPPLNSTKNNSALNDSALRVSAHNTSPHFESNPVSYSSPTNQPIPTNVSLATEPFTVTSKDYLDRMTSGGTYGYGIKNSSQSLNDSVEVEDDDDDDFEQSQSGSKNRKTSNNAHKFYNKSRKGNLSRVPMTNQSKLSCSATQGSQGTVHDPHVLDDDTTKPKKRNKLNRRKGPVLSNKDEFEVVSLEIERMRFGKHKSSQSQKIKFRSEDITIVFSNYSNGEEKETYINYNQIVSADVFLENEPPYLMAISVKEMDYSRLNSFYSSVHNNCPYPLVKCSKARTHVNKLIVIKFKYGLPHDRIAQQIFHDHLQKLPCKIERSAQYYLDILGKEEEVSPPLQKPIKHPQNQITSSTSLPESQNKVLPSSGRLRRRTRGVPLYNVASQVSESVTPLPIHVPDTSPKYQDDECVLSYVFRNTKSTGPSFVISGQDMNSLSEQSYLNDQIINFFLRYYWEKLSDPIKDSVYVFNTFFYSRLVNSSRDDKDKKNMDIKDKIHNRVKSWTKYVNIFEKKFILVPVCYRSHWFVVILCNIGEFTEPSPNTSPTATTAGNKRKLSTRVTRKKAQNKKKNNNSGDNSIIEMMYSDIAIDVEEEECHDGSMSIIDELSGVICTNKNETCEQTSGCESVSITSSTDSSIEKMEVDEVHNGCDTDGRGTNEDDIDGRGTDELGNEGCGTCNDDVMESKDAPVDLTEKDDVTVDTAIDEADGCVTCIPESSPEDSVTSTTNNNSEDYIDIGGGEDHEEGEVEVDEGDDTTCIVVTESSQEGITCTSPLPSADTEIIEPCLIVLDSMLIKRISVGQNLRKYLTVEYSKRYENITKDFNCLPTQWPKVPGQTNGFDCGVYMLTYIENFFKQIEQNNRIPNSDEWLGFSDMKHKRKELRDKILSLKNSSSPSTNPASSTSHTHSNNRTSSVSPVHV